MPRDYWFSFNVLPSAAASLSPTFIVFINGSGQTIAPPSIAETYSGSGLYKTSYQATQTIAFVLDGATTGLSTNNRYITGVFDTQDLFGNSLISIGTSLVAMGTTLTAMGVSATARGNTLSTLAGYIGSTASTFGDSSTNPSTVFGYQKRVVEFLEGNQTYTKSTGGLVFYSRGSSATIASKTVSDTTTQTTKT